MSYQLVVRRYGDEEYRHVVATRDTQEALGRVEDGLNINLDHVNYYSDIEEVPSP